MKRMKTILGVVITVLTFAMQSQKANAADEISHFYGSTFFAMASGMDPDLAVGLAVGNEMIDRGIYTNPMGLPTPRLLFHFLGTPVEFTVNEAGLKRGLAIATIKHPLAFNLLDRALKTKDVKTLGAVFHLVLDSFFHAGYSNLLGHGEGGHRPDMPYEEVQKARQAFQAIIELTYLIRDMQAQQTGKAPDLKIMERIVAEVSADPIYLKQLQKVTAAQSQADIVAVVAKRPDLFTQVILDNKLVRNAFFTNIEKSDQYWTIAMKEIFDIYKAKGYTQISKADALELAAQFQDVSARTDLDPMQSLKIVLFRILQTQDKVLSAVENQEMLRLGFSQEELSTALAKGHFDFSRLAGFSDIKGFNLNIENETKKNADALTMLVANMEIFAKNIKYTDKNGEIKNLPSHAWSQDMQTMAENIFPDVLSWIRLLNKEGQIRTVEHRDIGNLVSTQTDIDNMRNLMDYQSEYLDNTIKTLKALEANSETLVIAARLKAIAEVAYHLANNSTKDLFPGKISPIKKVVYEDDKLIHACYAKECRVEAVKNLVVEYTNVKLTTGPVGIHTYLINLVKNALAKISPKKTVAAVDAQSEMISDLVRQANFEMGFGTKDASGKITLPTDRKDVLEIAPNLTLSGYRKWASFTRDYVYKIMMKFSKNKNKAIAEYIRNGEKTKTLVLEALSRYYLPEAQAEGNRTLSQHYGKVELDSKKSGISGLPSSVLRCEAMFN